MFKRFSIVALMSLAALGFSVGSTSAFAAGFYSKSAVTVGGGWHDGLYVPDLLEQQYSQGWGYGD